MSTAWIPPRRSYHLRVFAICLGLVVIALLSFLFGVQLEAVRPATGLIQARNAFEVRAPIAGLLQLSWLEEQLLGSSEESAGSNAHAAAHKKLEVGDVLRPGQLIALISRDEIMLAWGKLEGRIKDHQKLGKPVEELQAQLAHYKEQFTKGNVHAPKGEHWLVTKLAVVHLQAVKAGDLIASLVPVDPATAKPRDLVAELEIAESHAGDVAVGQPVRLYSSMFAQRLHGHADGRIERIEPMGEAGPAGERKFRASAAISQAPFPLHLGSSVRAEIIVGKKRVYKIILEQ